MALPVLAYGHPLLRQSCNALDLPQSSDALHQLITLMWTTMYAANGSGLAANQVGVNARIFVVDSRLAFASMPVESRPVYFPDNSGIKEVFINAQIIGYSERNWSYEEGCLSIPGVHANVKRPWAVEIQYVNQQLQPQHRVFQGLSARMILHEYDHIQGALLTDHMKRLRLRLLQSKLKRISRGKVKTSYALLPFSATGEKQ